MPELVEKRTEFSKTLTTADPNRFRVEVYKKPAHFQRGSVWHVIDTTVMVRDGIEVCDTLPFRFEVLDSGIGYRLVFGESQTEVQLNMIGGTVLASLPIRLHKTRRENQIWWNDVLPGLDIGLVVSRQGIRTLKRIKDKTAPRTFTWEVIESGTGITSKPPIGRDNENEAVVAHKPQRRDLEIVETRQNISDAGKRTYLITETWTGRVYSRNRTTRVLELTDDPVYPVTLDPTFGPSTTTSDDGHELSGTWTDTFYSFNVGANGGTPYNAGVRFTNVTVPQGATITSATLALDIESIYNDPAAMTVYGDDVDDAPAWSSSSRPTSGFTQTTANVTSDPTATGTHNITITSIVQEIVNRAGWASGNAQRFGLFGAGAGSAWIVADAAGDATGNETSLTIDYTVGGASTHHLHLSLLGVG